MSNGYQLGTAQTFRDVLTSGDGVVQSPAEDALGDGRLFVADTTFIDGISNAFSVLFENPTNDTVAIAQALIHEASTTAHAPLYRNPDGMNVPTTQRETAPLNLGSGASTQMQIKAEETSGQMSAGTGTNLGLQLTITADYHVRRFPILVQPGQSVGASIPSGGLSTNASAKISIIYQEAPV